MRILIATGIFPPDIGGPATYTKLIAQELSERGHNVIVVTYGERQHKVKNISRALPKGVRHFVYFWKVFWHGRYADVIYAQDPVSAGLPAAWAARILRKRFLVRIAGDYAWEQGVGRFGVLDLLDEFVKKTYGPKVEQLRRIQRKVARSAHRIVVPSEYLKKIVMAWGIQAERIVVIRTVVRAPQIIEREAVRKKLGLSDTDIFLLSIGRLVPWKGFEALIRVFPAIKKRFGVRFVIVGGGPDYDRLYPLAKSSGVVMAGALPAGQVAEYLASADIFLLNTAYEGFSHQILEAFAHGVPVITTPAGGNAEIVRNGENALVVPYNDEGAWAVAIGQTCEDVALRERLKIGGRASLGEYSVERMMEKLMALFTISI